MPKYRFYKEELYPVFIETNGDDYDCEIELTEEEYKEFSEAYDKYAEWLWKLSKKDDDRVATKARGKNA